MFFRTLCVIHVYISFIILITKNIYRIKIRVFIILLVDFLILLRFLSSFINVCSIYMILLITSTYNRIG